MSCIDEKIVQKNKEEKIEKLMQDVLEGREEALLELLSCFKGITLGVARRYIHSLKDNIDSSEIHQYSLLTLYHCIKNYDKNMQCSLATFYGFVFDRNIRLYLRQLNSNKSKIYRNALSIDAHISESDTRYVADVLQNDREQYDPVMAFENTLLQETIQEELDKVEKWEADLFVMWMEGYTYKEIADSCGLNRRQAEYIIKGIRENLKCRLKAWKKE